MQNQSCLEGELWAVCPVGWRAWKKQDTHYLCPTPTKSPSPVTRADCFTINYSPNIEHWLNMKAILFFFCMFIFHCLIYVYGILAVAWSFAAHNFVWMSPTVCARDLSLIFVCIFRSKERKWKLTWPMREKKKRLESKSSWIQQGGNSSWTGSTQIKQHFCFHQHRLKIQKVKQV